jgi:UDP-N-acetylmuramyl pentapeptide phosphotransferase/UDP-N-acetylglucosamine-1-phosphate transferase
MISPIVKILIPAALSFAIGIGITPIVAHYLYTYRAWKKRPGKEALDGTIAREFNRLHIENEVRAPRMGGIVVWASVLLTIFGIALLGLIPSPYLSSLNFLALSWGLRTISS